MAFGFQLVGMFEGNGDGLQWHTVWKPATLDDDLAVIHIMAMLVFDGVLYFVIAIYVEAVFPGEFGIPLPWYFPFTVSNVLLQISSIVVVHITLIELNQFDMFYWIEMVLV